MKTTENTTRAHVQTATAATTTTGNARNTIKGGCTMKTTTNTTTRRNPNLDRETILEAAADIMTRAHELTRRLREREPGLDYRTTLAAALRELWEEYGMTALEQWQSMSDDRRDHMIRGMVGWDVAHDDARINRKTGKPAAPLYYYMDGKHPAERRDLIEEVIQETYAQLLEALANDPEEALAPVVRRAIHRAAIRMCRMHRNPRAIRHTVDEDGNELDIIDTKAGAAAARIESPETAAVIEDLIDRACKDDKDRAVVALITGGWTQTETAARLDIGQRAVSKRLDGIRDRLAETIGRDPREKKAPRGKNARRA